MTNRKLNDFGLDPVIGYGLLLAGFIGLSIYLFEKSEFAEYFYILVSLGLTSKLSETKRNDFLKVCFSKKKYQLTRIIENLLASIPFLLFLLYKQLFLTSIVLIGTTILFGLTSFKTTFNFTIPTPFYKRPFEFTVGFRNTFYIFPISYCLTFIAISVDNFNLGIFSLLLVFLTILSYYAKPENEYYVWSNSLTPKQFLVKKIKTSLLFSSILGLPIVLTLGIYYLGNIEPLLVFLLLGYVFLITIILAKYSAYPDEMNLPQGILIAICLFFPPLLIVIIPYFYNQSTKRLSNFLEC